MRSNSNLNRLSEDYGEKYEKILAEACYDYTSVSLKEYMRDYLAAAFKAGYVACEADEEECWKDLERALINYKGRKVKHGKL